MRWTPEHTFAIVDNQKYGLDVIRKYGLGEVLGLTDISGKAIWTALSRLSKHRESYLQRNQRLIDGRGAERVVHLLDTQN